VIPVVIDTGVFVAGVFWRAEPHRCLNAWLRGQVSLVISAAIYQEYARTLRKLQLTYATQTDVAQWLALVQDHGQWVQPWPLASPVCRDPKDDLMIEAALAGGARTIIARDADLTVLDKPFGIQVLTPRAWLAGLSRADRRKLG
jgi:putative PIN family toxin of toxin-antitoxin system